MSDAEANHENRIIGSFRLELHVPAGGSDPYLMLPAEDYPRDADVSEWHVCNQGAECYSVHDRRSGPVACDFPSVEAAEAFIALVREHGTCRLTAG